MTELLSFEQDLIKNSLLKKTHKQIADELDIDVEAVIAYALQINLGVPTKDERVKATAKPRPAAKTKVKLLTPAQQEEKRRREENKKLQEQQKKQRMEIEAERILRKRTEQTPKFVNRRIDYTGMKHVKVNNKTWIVVKPGTDIKPLLEAYKEKSLL